MAKTLPSWSCVKNSPDMRLEYHRLGFDIALESMEEYTHELLKEPDNLSSLSIQIIRLIADSMVKSFNQLYYDVAQGFPGYSAAEWQSTNTKQVEISCCELSLILDALLYANNQISSSNGDVAVYGQINDPAEQLTMRAVMQSVTNKLEIAIQKTDSIVIKTIG